MADEIRNNSERTEETTDMEMTAAEGTTDMEMTAAEGTTDMEATTAELTAAEVASGATGEDYVEDSIEVEGEDTGICADGYGMTDITTKKLSKERFRAKFAFHADFQMLQDVLASGGKAFGLRKSGFFKEGPIEVVFTVRVSENSYNCDQILFSDSVPESSRDTIRKHIRLEVARLALLANCHNNTFLGELLPELVREIGSPNWGFGLAFVLIYAVCLHSVFDSYVASIALGVAMGISMSFLFRPVKYHFAGSKTTAS